MDDQNEQRAKQPMLNPTWYFDPDLDASTKPKLTKALWPTVSRWFDAAWAEQRECLRKYPNQKYAAWLEWDDFGTISYLFMLTCRDDKAEPSTWAIFVGSRTYTLDQRARIQNFLIEDTSNQPGGKTTIVERRR